MAMAFHEMTNTQAMKKTKPELAGLAKWNPEMFDQWKVDGLKTGRRMRRVRGTIDVTPRTVAKVAPSFIPNEHRMYSPINPTKVMTSTPMETGVPSEPSGEKLRPSGTWKRT